MPQIDFTDYSQNLNSELENLENELKKLDEKLLHPKLSLKLKQNHFLEEESQKLKQENYKPQKLDLKFSPKQFLISNEDIFACLEDIYKLS